MPGRRGDSVGVSNNDKSGSNAMSVSESDAVSLHNTSSPNGLKDGLRRYYTFSLPQHIAANFL